MQTYIHFYEILQVEFEKNLNRPLNSDEKELIDFMAGCTSSILQSKIPRTFFLNRFNTLLFYDIHLQYKKNPKLFSASGSTFITFPQQIF